MNLSVTGRLELQEKHTFQHLGSGGESSEERSGGEQGAKEERLFGILRSLSDLMCIRPESLSMLELQLSILN